MRSTLARRTAAAASVACLALLSTACGGSDADEDDKAKGGKATSAASAAPAAKALTAAELEKAALVTGDVKGHKVEKAGAKDVLAPEAVKADQAGCRPFAYAMSGVPVGEPGATVQRVVSSEAEKTDEPSTEELADMTEEEIEEALTSAFDVTTTFTSLSSYEGGGAGETVRDLRTAATNCAGGFTLTVDGEKQKVTKLTEESVSGGDEALAWTVSALQDGEPVETKLVVVRQGTTLASFASVNMAALSTGADFELPTAVVEAQLAKLG
ncbi:hypothetical protein ACWD4J_25905 [Streptomyces sp. NPDC002577]